MPLNPRIAKLSQDDWACAALQDVFIPDFYSELVAGLGNLKWSVASQRFYRQREVNLRGIEHYERLFNRARRSRIASDLGIFFGVEFEEDFDVAAHKMVHGDFIDAHTDANHHGETHRLTVTLNDDWGVQDGGVLLCLNGRSLQSLRDAWLPTANNGFLFEISDSSFHAVTPITGSTPRYSLIMTFKRKRYAAFGGDWVPFPMGSDVVCATSTGSHMGIPAETFSTPYRIVPCKSVVDLRQIVGDVIDNAPDGWSYRSGYSVNVDRSGQPHVQSDSERINAVRSLNRVPPIILVRRKSGRHCLVDGSHRLSFATDANANITAVVFDEV